MLGLSEIAPIVHRVLDERLGDREHLHVSVEARPDSYMEPALFVTVDVSDDAFDSVLKERMLLVGELASALSMRGEDRFPFVEITSPAQREEALREDAA